MESNNNLFNEIYQEYLKNKDDITDEVISFNKEHYTKFYNLIINVLLFFILNSYETQFKNLDNDFNLENLNNETCDYNKTIEILKIQLNIYWDTIKKKQISDQLTVDIDDLIKLRIIRHKYCLFTFIKNVAISVIKDISRIKLENITNFTEFKEKIGILANSLLQITKVSMLEDEDTFDCDDCIYEIDKTLDTETFWK